MKNKIKVIIICVIISFLIITGLIVFNIFSDKTRLSVGERSWINENLSTIQNISVLNDNEIFGNAGKGVYFDFLKDFNQEYGIELNPIPLKTGEISNGITLGYSNSHSENDVIFYTDHYVVLSKSYELIKTYHDLKGKTIGILSSNMSHVTSYLEDLAINYIQYNTNDDLETALINGEVNFIIAPRFESLDFMLEKNLFVIEHLSDVPVYFLLQNKESEFGSLLNKFFIKWQDKLQDFIDDAKFSCFTSQLKISETEIDALRSMDYDYGFVNTSPYEVITGGNYGGIVAVYLKAFTEFSDIDINFTKYKNFKKFTNAIDKKDIDIYYNYYNINNNYQTIKGGMAIKYDIIASYDNPIVINSLTALKGKTIYALEDSIIKNYLTSLGNLNVKTFKTMEELFKIAKKDNIIVIDSNIFDYYKSDKLSKYTSRHDDYIDAEYSFKVNNNNAFYKLLERYINIVDYQEFVNKGVYNHSETVKSGTILGTMAKYFLYILIITTIIVYLLYRRTKKITIVKRIKKLDKMKYIDQLTSLKNRNYLNENIENWNNNKVYPQSMIVIDLNNIQYINDTLGYEEGDKQIKAVANILIKTQLDYSDVMRTDGNEFLIYLIGYTQKQVTNYIHKLNKEFKKLPYEYGAEFGYSMITDDIKTIEDAINEAVEEMKVQKKDIPKEVNNESKS